jgi:hypothetical protein
VTDPEILIGGVFSSTHLVEDRVQRERGSGLESPLSAVPLKLQRNETYIIIVVRKYFSRKLEFRPKLSNLGTSEGVV